jgi:hypothetical protein
MVAGCMDAWLMAFEQIADKRNPGSNKRMQLVPCRDRISTNPDDNDDDDDQLDEESYHIVTSCQAICA